MDEPGSVCGPRREERRGGLEVSRKSASVRRVRTRSLQRLDEFPEREQRNPIVWCHGRVFKEESLACREVYGARAVR